MKESNKTKKLIEAIEGNALGKEALLKAGYSEQTLQEMKTNEAAWLEKKNRLTNGERKVTDAELQYWETIFSGEVKKIETLDDGIKQFLGSSAKAERKMPQYKIESAKAKYIVWQIAVSMAEKTGRQFEINDKNREAFAELTKYFTGDPGCKYNLKKGLYIYGPTGSGKTFILDVFRKFVEFLHFSPMEYKKAFANKIVESLSENPKETKQLQKYKKNIWFFDDIGEEKDQVVSFGERHDPIKAILKSRCDSFERSGLITHISTNLPTEEIKARYGDRIASRFCSMFNVIRINCEDFRRK